MPQAARAVRAAVTARRGGYSGALTVESMNPNIREMQYAVRGRLVMLADKIKRELKEKPGSHPFDRVTMCNIGNPQQVGQTPVTFPRQVLALCVHPELRDKAKQIGIPDDVVERANKLLDAADGSIGAYSTSKGLLAIRESICEFIKQRDGDGPVPITPDMIFCTDGASTGVKTMLSMCTSDENDGVMIPIPQYPLYSAALATINAKPIPYYLDESKGWSMSVDELRRAVEAGRKKGHNARAIVIINPGNPTGQCLSREDLYDILMFARDENLVVLADEVYQANVYASGKEFVSCREVLASLPDPSEVLVASLHSTSKGFLGECGMRGGYLEVANMEPEVSAELYKMFSVNLCSNLPGQIITECMVNPPKEGDASYPLYAKERDAILSSLKRRAIMVREGLEKMKGVSCNEVEGALYAFPSITLPKKFVDEALAAGVSPDALYSEKLLRATGNCIVPGSGFGQQEGTFHFRTTILPQEDIMPSVLESMQKWHNQFMAEYD